MSSSTVLTPDAILTLYSSRNNGTIENITFTVQVILLEESSMQSGIAKYTITISDGTHCLDCCVVPIISNLFITSAVKRYSVVGIRKITMMEISGLTKFMVVDMVPLSLCNDVVGAYVNMDCKRQLSPLSSDNCLIPSKQLCADDVRTLFHEAKSYFDEKPSKDNPSDIVDGVKCKNCHNQPCDWTKYGPKITDHLNNNYVGYYMNEGGTVVDELTEKSSIITNHQLQFLAYSAFTSMKHGYLGKKSVFLFLTVFNVALELIPLMMLMLDSSMQMKINYYLI